jgi:hypothetical protein
MVHGYKIVQNTEEASNHRKYRVEYPLTIVHCKDAN